MSARRMLVNAILRALIMMVSGCVIIQLAGIKAWPELWRWPFVCIIGWFMAVGWFDFLDRWFDRWGFLLIPEEDES